MAGSAMAQDLRIYGVVRQHEVNVPLPNALVRVAVGALHLVTVQCDSSGRYEALLDVGRAYTLTYEADGRVSKNVQIDLSGAPKDDGGYGMNVDVRLFNPLPLVDVSFLQEPIGKAAYDSTSQSIVWDMTYTAPRMEQLNVLFPSQYDIKEQADTLQQDTVE